MEILRFSTLTILIYTLKCCLSQEATTVPPAVDCTPAGILQLNSPQFATLCRIPGNLTVADLPAGLVKLVGYTADQICDGDCRCVMGATKRGGMCGKRSDGTVFCKCDYGTTETPPLSAGSCLGVLGETIRSTVCATGIGPQACNSDCQCSHGYGNTGNHKCTKDNGQAGNTNTYCVCGNHTNIS